MVLDVAATVATIAALGTLWVSLIVAFVMALIVHMIPIMRLLYGLRAYATQKKNRRGYTIIPGNDPAVDERRI
jgi:hypothetical protein